VQRRSRPSGTDHVLQASLAKQRRQNVVAERRRAYFNALTQEAHQVPLPYVEMEVDFL